MITESTKIITEDVKHMYKRCSNIQQYNTIAAVCQSTPVRDYHIRILDNKSGVGTMERDIHIWDFVVCFYFISDGLT